MRNKLNAFTFFFISFFLIVAIKANSKTDSTKILDNISKINQLFETKVDSCKPLILLNIEESKKINFEKGTARLYLLLSQYYILKGQPDSAKKIIPELEKFTLQLKDKNLAVSILLKISLIYSDLGDFKSATTKAIEAQKIAENIKNYRLLAKINHDLGFIYSNKQLYSNALTYFKKGLNYAFLSKDTFSIANMYARIGGVFNETTIPDSGLYYNSLALKYFENIKMKRGIGVCYNNIAGSYELMKRYNKAVEYYNKALPIRTELGDEYAITIINYNLGVCYLHMNKYSLAEDYLKTSLNRTKSEKDYSQVLETLKQLCVLYSNSNNLSNYKVYADEYMQLKDSITSADNIKAISELQQQYESEKKEKDIVLLKKENEKQEEVSRVERKNKFIVLAGATIIVLLMSIFGLILFKRFRVSQKQNRIIEAQKFEVEKQRDIIELKNKEIIDSIKYAKRIQQSLMPTEKYIGKHLKNN